MAFAPQLGGVATGVSYRGSGYSDWCRKSQHSHDPCKVHQQPGTAADVANKYFTTTTPNAPGAAGQWFLPSKDELNELCKIYSNGRMDTANYRELSKWLHRKYITDWWFCYVLASIGVLLSSTDRPSGGIRISTAGIRLPATSRSPHQLRASSAGFWLTIFYSLFEIFFEI